MLMLLKRFDDKNVIINTDYIRYIEPAEEDGLCAILVEGGTQFIIRDTVDNLFLIISGAKN